MASRTFRLDLQYEGAPFQGWQTQPNGPTVEAALVTAYSGFLRTPVKIEGSGRTDAGVHGRHQIASLEAETTVPEKAILLGIKPSLHEGLSVFRATEVEPGWKPRPVFQREYRYFLWKSPVPPLFYRPYSAGTLYDLDPEAMRNAATRMTGQHDFSSFRASGCSSKHAIRRLDRVEIVDRGEVWEFRLVGNAFVRQMVRILVGTLVEVGRGWFAPGDIDRIFEARNRDAAGPTLPPEGLFFWRITYREGEEAFPIPPTVWETPGE